jgi:MFS family permease
VVALLWVVAALNYVDRQVIFSIFPLLRSDLHVTNVQLGMLGTVFLWVYGVVSPFGGYLADRFNRRKVILASFGIWSVVTFLLGLSHTYLQVLSAQALMGVSEACYLPAALALIADYHGEATRSRAIGLHQSGLYAGVALGGVGGGWIGQHYGWHGVFYVLGAGGVFYFSILFVALKDSPRPKRGKTSESPMLPFTKAIRELASNGAFLILVLANCFAAIAFWCIYAWLALFLFERYRLSLTSAGFSSTFYIQVASFAGILGGGWLADGWTRTNRRARGWTQAIGLMIAGPALLLVGSTSSWWILVPCLVCFGVGRGFFDCNLMPVLCQIIPAELRATAYGIFNFTSCVCGGVMALVAGMLKDSVGLAVAIEISALCMIAGAVCLVILSVTRLGVTGVPGLALVTGTKES